MWWRNRLYFLSDRGTSRRLDLWVTDPSGRSARRVTHVSNLDIDVPTLGADAITFGLGGRIWCLDLPSEHLHEVPVTVESTERVQLRTIAAAPFVRVSNVGGAPDAALSRTAASRYSRHAVTSSSTGPMARRSTSIPGRRRTTVVPPSRPTDAPSPS